MTFRVLGSAMGRTERKESKMCSSSEGSLGEGQTERRACDMTQPTVLAHLGTLTQAQRTHTVAGEADTNV